MENNDKKVKRVTCNKIKAFYRLKYKKVKQRCSVRKAS